MSADPDRMEVEYSSPIGKLAAKGVRLSDLIALLTFAASVSIAIFIWAHIHTSDQATAAMIKALQDSTAAQTQAIGKLDQAQVELNYIITLSPDERKSLDLRMPPSLREKLRNR